MPTPLLIWSDSASASSGLARITRDLTVRVATHLSDVFKVATIGYGAAGSTKLPFPQYSWTHNEEWVIHDFPEIWEDFAGGERGIVMTVQDASRMMAFSRPSPATCTDQTFINFLSAAPFERWGYFPIDANGPNGKLSVMLGEAMLGYDRILAYTKWAQRIVESTIGLGASQDRSLSHIPHGIDTSVFYPRDREESRKMFGLLTASQDIPIKDNETLIGIVATNQARKDFGQAIEVVAEIARNRKIMLWIHTDAMDRFWSIPYLLRDYGINKAFVSLQNLNDDVMAKLYSACDLTLGIGLGEGWGFPLAESLACGTPVVHGKYGGGAEYLPKDFLVPVLAYRTEGIFSCQRPVFKTSDWVRIAEMLLKRRRDGEVFTFPKELGWDELWSRWESWFRSGVEKCKEETVVTSGY